MNHWNNLLESLATSGGRIFILLLSSAALLAVIIHILHGEEMNEQVSAVIVSTFSGFVGALLAVLTGGARPPTNGNGALPKSVTITEK